ncbi:hypothetical protein A9Q76_05900 [Arcobacter sp. 31_11_sub10_T18]|nr:hypothetical protein A9Q76_05900 [Arcobacter sp. 31_11_sub10_T18]
MIVTVKRKNYKKLIIKAISLLSVVAMFTVYYNYMSTKLNQESMQKKEVKNKETLKSKKAKAIEKIIYREAETAVDLIGQINVKEIKILGKRLFLVCDTNTDLEPLMIRYGVMALVKHSVKDIKIAINLDLIVASKYDEV